MPPTKEERVVQSSFDLDANVIHLLSFYLGGWMVLHKI